MTKINRAFVCVALVLVTSTFVACSGGNPIAPQPPTTPVPPSGPVPIESKSTAFSIGPEGGFGISVAPRSEGTVKISIAATPDGNYSVMLAHSNGREYTSTGVVATVSIVGGRGNAELAIVALTNLVVVKNHTSERADGEALLDVYR